MPPRIASAACRLELRASKCAGHEAVSRDQQWDSPLVHFNAEVCQRFLEASGLYLVFHQYLNVPCEAAPYVYFWSPLIRCEVVLRCLFSDGGAREFLDSADNLSQ